MAVLVVDDDAVFRRFVVETLESAGFRTVEAENADEAISATSGELLEAAVLDVALPGVSGFGLCRQLRARHGDKLAVIFVSGERADPLDRAAGILVGGDDYLVKPVNPDELLARLQRILVRANGRAPESTAGDLTDREMEVLQIVAEGGSAADVAVRLVISRKTVSSHMQRIFTKLDVHTRAQAVAVAYAKGLIRVSGRGGDVDPHIVALDH